MMLLRHSGQIPSSTGVQNDHHHHDVLDEDLCKTLADETFYVLIGQAEYEDDAHRWGDKTGQQWTWNQRERQRIHHFNY